MQNLMGRIRRCAEDYNMICEGDKIAVGVSGGKDSLSLLYLLAALRRYYPVHYDLQAVTIDMGLPGMDYSPVAELCAKLDVPYQIKKTEIGPIIFDYRHEKNPCSMCAKMRRGALNDMLLELGCNKIALGHHFDDAVETFLMSLLYEGRIGCFEPVTYLSRTGITQIRPMLYVGEQAITHFAEKYELPIVHNVCPADKHTKRQEVKELIVSLQAQYPDLKSKIFGAMQRQPLPNWGVEPPRRGTRSKDDLREIRVHLPMRLMLLIPDRPARFFQPVHLAGVLKQAQASRSFQNWLASARFRSYSDGCVQSRQDR